MFRTSLKGLLARKLRLVTTVLAVTIGVSFMAGTLVLTDTIRKTFDDLFADVYKGTDAVVRGKALFNGPQNTGDQRPRVDAGLVPVVERVPGVAVAEGGIFGYTRLVDKHGQAIGNPAAGAPTIGMSWLTDKQLNPLVLVKGHPPAAADEIVIDVKSARDNHFHVGDSAQVLTQAPPQRMRISGIAKFGTADSPGGASVVVFTTPVAQRLIAEPGKFDSIWVVAEKGVSQTEVAARIAKALPPGVEALTGKQITKENQSDVRKGLAFFTTLLFVFVIVALLVGAFMIFNSFSITVAQRTRENALFRAIGASRRQVLWSVLLEALAIGLVASLIGLAVGVAVAAGLKVMLHAIGFDIPAGGIVFSVRTAVISVFSGVLITTVAAASPARKAGKVPPVAAMQGITTGSTGFGSKERVMVGLLILSSGIGALFFGLFTKPDNALTVVGVGALLVFFAVSVLGRTVALPLSRMIGAPLARMRSMTGRMARENAMRNPKRTAATASALMIGVGLVGFITVFVSSTKASINATIDRAFTGDLVVDSGAGMSGGIDASLAKKLNTLPQVRSATGVRMGAAKINGSVQLIVGADPRTAFDIIDVKPLQGATRDLGRDAIAVYKDVAKDKHLRIGDTVPVVFKDSGAKRLRVALIYGENQPAGDYLLGIAAYDANFTNHYDFQVYIKKAGGASMQATTAAVKGVAKEYPGAKVLDLSQFKQEQAKQINQLLALVYALLFLASIVAVLGIGNTLALSIFERTREVGLLRAVGMSRSQLRRTIRWESVIIALQGTALGLLIGLFFGWALVAALHDKGIDQFSVPVLSLVVVVVIAGIAGVVAAILPARRAAKLDILKAIASQ